MPAVEASHIVKSFAD